MDAAGFLAAAAVVLAFFFTSSLGMPGFFFFFATALNLAAGLARLAFERTSLAAAGASGGAEQKHELA